MPNSYIRRIRKPDTNKTTRVYVPRWIDPFSWIQGSSIEKMVMAELVRRGVWFEHTPQRNTLGGFVDPTWEPDFLLPQYKIWIEIQGGYFHTLPGAVERDALRFVMIEHAGWRPIFWWEDDIRNRLHDIMNQIPELYMVDRALNSGYSSKNTTGLPFYEGGDGVDHLAGLRKALANRARPPQDLKVRRRKKRKKKYGSSAS